jgi:hypothetical protein
MTNGWIAGCVWGDKLLSERVNFHVSFECLEVFRCCRLAGRITEKMYENN